MQPISLYPATCMGIGFVLLIWAVVGIILACIGALVVGAAATFLTRGATRDRSLTLLASFAFPFVCLGWAALLFVFQAFVNGAMHRDPGLGDTWTCPLPNGYAILMIDDTDHGWIYNPKTQPGSGVSELDDAVDCVVMAQVSGRYILGGADSNSTAALGADLNHIDSYFILDTQAGKKTVFSNFDQLRQTAQTLGVSLNLEPIHALYSKYRYTWFDILVGVSLCIPLLIYFGILVAKIRRLRRSAGASEVPVLIPI